MVGKKVMLKSAAQSISVYSMSYFNLSGQVIHDLNSLFVGYFLGDCGSKKRIH